MPPTTPEWFGNVRILFTRRMALDVPDGINVFIFAMAQALILRGHEVLVVCSSLPDLEEIDRLFSPLNRPRLVGLSSRNLRTAADHVRPWVGRLDVVREFNPDVSVINGAIPVRLPGRSIIIAHDVEARGFGGFRWLYKKWTYSLADSVFATCTEIRDSLEDTFPEFRPVGVLPTCVAVDRYAPRTRSEREPAILHLGTAPYKRAEATLDAFARMKEHARLLVTGPVTPAVAAALQALSPEKRSKVDMLGFVSAERLVGLLGTVMAVSVPSVYRVPVCSPTVLESFASGTPVVTGFSITADVVQHGRNGYLCSTTKEMAAAMDWCIADHEDWTRASAEARATAKRFSSDTVAQRLLDEVS